LYGYVVRLRGNAPGAPAPDWLIDTLATADDGGPVRFRGITTARPALLTGRPYDHDSRITVL
ncbi:MAG: hypothetical protein V4671_07875, partial [Armatimonadota bacterium]